MSIYKDCDIRGIYGEEFDEKDAYLIGRAVGTLQRGKRLAVGGDIRLSTPVLKASLMRGLMETGIHVIDVGCVTTPMFYYALDAAEFGTEAPQGGIMVTASHNPARYNGFKMMFGNFPVTSEEIKKVENLVHLRDFLTGNGSYETRNVEKNYAAFIERNCRKGSLKIVLDCCDGATSKIVPQIMETMGYEVSRLYCGYDGNFPNRNPNPAEYNCLADVCKKVLETGADLGAAYDGDGDRVVFIDNRGHYLTSEKSFAVFIRQYLKGGPGSFVYDQKSASLVKNTILAYGGMPVMERSGYGFIKQRFLKERALAAGEISGHFFFREIGRDDGLYATLKMCEILEEEGRSLAEMAEEFPDSIITPDLRVFCPYEEQEKWLDKAAEMGECYPVSRMDGVRIEFADGWFLLRKSVTEQAMTYRIEAADAEAFERIRGIVKAAVPEVKESLLNLAKG